MVACEDDYGNRVENGTEWPSREFMYYRKCALDAGDGQNRIVTVACTTEEGQRVEDGGSWTSLDGRFTKTCRIDAAAGSGEVLPPSPSSSCSSMVPMRVVRVQIESAPRKATPAGCRDDEGNLVPKGAEWEVANGRFVKACRIAGGEASVPVVWTGSPV